MASIPVRYERDRPTIEYASPTMTKPKTSSVDSANSSIRQET